jgi:signal transduction histidine kinase/CheY-like chemotaxis protein
MIVTVWNTEGRCLGTADANGRASQFETESRAWFERESAERVELALRGVASSAEFRAGSEHVEARFRPVLGAGGDITAVLGLLLNAGADERARAALAWRVELEQLVTGLSTHFIRLPPQVIDGGIDHALEAIGAFCKVDRAYIFQLGSDGASMSNTHEWCREGISAQLELLQGIPLEAFPWLLDRIRRQEVIHVARAADLPEEASLERAALAEQGVRSLVAVPMVRENSVLGFLGFESIREERTWQDEDISLLKIVGEMFVGALDRKFADLERRSLEAQLIQARSLDNVAKLAGGVAHDFNNQLGVILNYATILKRELRHEPRLEEFAAELFESALQASELTRQLLIVGRRGVVQPVVLEINDVIEAVSNILRRTLGEGVELDLRLDPHAGTIHIGLPQLEQVVVNLAMNARDAMGDGRLVIETRAIEVDQAQARRHIDLMPGRYVLFSVTDNGAGMNADVAAKAFEPFFSTKGPSGTGLGLSTVHSIVKQAGGHVLLKSELGKGTRVDVYLPRLPSGPDPVDAPKEVATPLGRGETILLVEDSEPLRRLLKMVLGGARYRVLAAADPLEALRISEEHAGEIDLVLSDVILPTMSGRMLVETLAERWGLRRSAFVSGYNDDELQKRGVLESGVRLLPKPFLERELLCFVRESLDAPFDSAGN